MSEIQISLCMIVRDEEEMLPGFLDSVAGLWDEFIAVDTGSTDRTAEILRAAGAQVVPFPWCDDFAAARNASLAPATGRWILFLDADERVTDGLAARIRALPADEKAGAATVLMRNRIPGGQYRLAPLLRLFRNDPQVRFEHRIHEDPSASVAALLERENLEMRHLDGIVDHLGYVREVAADRNKKDRDLELLRAALAADPDDFYCRFKILEIARFWNDAELWKEAAAETAARLEAAPRSELENLRARHWGGEMAALVSQGLHEDPAAALAWLDRAAGSVTPSAALHLRRGYYLESLDRADEARTAFEQCLALARHDPSGQAAIRPLLGLCRMAAAAGDLERALELSREAAFLGPLDPEALLALAAFHPEPVDGQAPGVIGDLLAAHPEADVPLARALLTVGRIDAAAGCLRRRSAYDPDAALGLLTCTLILGEPLDVQIDVDQTEADRLFRDWVQVLLDSKRPETIQAFAGNAVAVTEAFPWLPAYLESHLP